LKKTLDPIQRVGIAANSGKVLSRGLVQRAIRLIGEAGRTALCDAATAQLARLSGQTVLDVGALTKQVDLLLVVGARNSSNSNRLREIGQESGVNTYLLEDVSALDAKWLQGVETVGITAGASTPEELVRELIEKLGAFGKIELTIMHGIEEHIQFKLPDQLRPAAA